MLFYLYPDKALDFFALLCLRRSMVVTVFSQDYKNGCVDRFESS